MSTFSAQFSIFAPISKADYPSFVVISGCAFGIVNICAVEILPLATTTASAARCGRIRYSYYLGSGSSQLARQAPTIAAKRTMNFSDTRVEGFKS